MVRAWWTLAVIVCAGATGAGAQVTGYEAFTDWSSLPQMKSFQSVLASSYDRTGANDDFNYYQSPAGLQTTTVWATVGTFDGPGLLTRLWMPHATANLAIPIRLTLDDTVILTDSKQLFGGGVAAIQTPMVHTLIGGQVSYEPMGFARRLTIEMQNPGSGSGVSTRNYHQFNVQILPANQAVVPYSPTRTALQQARREQALSILANAGSSPFASSTARQARQTPTTSILPGDSVALLDVHDQGVVQRLWLRLGQTSDTALDSLRLRVRYDDAAQQAIDVPVSDFFGVGHGRANYQSLPLGTTADGGMYCYWPMPFRQAVHVELYNAGTQSVELAEASGEYLPQAVSLSMGYLHTQHGRELMATGQPSHEVLKVSGRGHYVGNILWYTRGGSAIGTLESDDIIQVDGTRWLYGTGMEDAYNGGFYYNHVWQAGAPDEPVNPRSGTTPLYGLLNFEHPSQGFAGVRLDQYRWLLNDAVPFDQEIHVTMENYMGANGINIGSTAFYYLQHPLPGDANGDGLCNFADYLALEAHFGQAGRLADGDFDGSGTVDFQDYLLLESSFGNSWPVPEPTCLLLAGTVMLAARRRRTAANSH